MNRKVGHVHTMVIYTMGGLGGVGSFFFLPAGDQYDMALFFSHYFLLPADEKAVLIEICGQSKKSKSYYASNFDKNEGAASLIYHFNKVCVV